ncbi:MAG: adenylate/guanylate cyclase domain-containing protein [Magnetococcales bacterium]|nr:adenylate/guanylate cyclase domain-containing protein [Magnetococcales bacterium]
MSRLPLMRLLTGAGVLLLFILHAVHLAEIPLLDKLEHLAYDLRLKVAMPGTQDARIVIVDIDEKSLARIGRWPWGRHQLALLTETLFDHYRILALGFDVVFAERDESSGLPVLDRLAAGVLQHQPNFLLELNRIRPALERDERFAKSLKGHPVILGYYFRTDKEPANSARSGVLPDPVISLEELGHSNIPFVPATGYGANLPVLQNAAQNAGFLDNPLVDADGVHRSLPLLREFQGKIYPSLALSLVRTILGDPAVTLGISPVAKNAQEVETGLEWVGLGPHHIPVDERASILIPYRGPPGTFPYVSAVDVLDKSANTGQLNDAIVLVGSSAPGLMDLHVTPVHPTFPGVEVHANVISGILDGAIKGRERHSLMILLVYYLLIAVTLLILAPRLSPAWGLYLTLLLGFLIIWSNALFWHRTDLVIPLAAPILLTLLLFMVHATFGVVTFALRDSRFSRMFAQHLPPALVDELLFKNQTSAPTRRATREVSVLIVNIRGFTNMTARMSADDLSQLLHLYLSRMTGAIHARRGTLDRYMGDMVMAFWGAPLDNPRHARDALKCARDMIRSVEELKDEFQAKGWPPLRISVGLDSGMAHVGELGSDFRPTYTVVGEVVNHAYRLETLARRHGVSLVVGARVRLALPEVLFRELELVHVRGVEEPVAIFEPVGFVDEVSSETRTELETYHQALALYRARRWEEARKRFQLLLERDPERQIHEIHLSRIQRLMAHPPSDAWDGVFPPRP